MFTTNLFRSTKQLPKHIKPLYPQLRSFHPTPAIMVKVGDSVPNVNLQEGSPGSSVNIADEIGSGNAIIVGVPAAFSPGCTDNHVPTYLMHPDIKKHKVYVVSVNDAFVMKAWGKKLDEDDESGIRFLADPHSEFTKALDLEFPGSEKFFGNVRSQRYALKIENGKVSKMKVEPDATKVVSTRAEDII